MKLLVISTHTLHSWRKKVLHILCSGINLKKAVWDQAVSILVSSER